MAQLKQFLSLLILSCLLLPLLASDDFDSLLIVDETRFPTYALVTTTELPPADRIDIAGRLQGITVIPEQNVTTIVRQIGEIEFFRINSVAGGGTADIPARLRTIGEHVYLWVEDGIAVEEATLNDIVYRFDIQVYEFVRGLWGSEAIPGIDDETRLHIVFTSRLRPGIGGYFSSANTYPAVIMPNSNEYDMMVLNASTLEPQYTDRGISSAAHEFQHMIHQVNDANESSWLNEGLATLTEYLPSLDPSLFIMNAFAQAPDTSLRMWGLGNNRAAEYGAPLMFMIYLHDRFGLEAVQQIASDSDNGLQSIDNMLQSRGETSVDVIFADWVLANLLREHDGNYSYQTLTDVSPLDLRAQTLNYPSLFTFELDQYSTDYYQYSNLPETVSISLQMADTVALIPTNATSGQMMWYSQRGDNSNSSLSRAFDLRNLNSAQLTFNVWYDLERDWDYAYISVSTDNGQTWELQSTELTTTSDSNGRAYGQGYTGQSINWRLDTLSLDSYVGQEILLRFEMLTDDAINQNGIAIDDIRLDAIGYYADMEVDDAGWLSDGWIRMDNRLPQRAWLQVVEQSETESIVHRFLANGNNQWQFDPAETSESLYISISPFAPMTTEKMSYTLQVE